MFTQERDHFLDNLNDMYFGLIKPAIKFFVSEMIFKAPLIWYLSKSRIRFEVLLTSWLSLSFAGYFWPKNPKIRVEVLTNYLSFR